MKKHHFLFFCIILCVSLSHAMQQITIQNQTNYSLLLSWSSQLSKQRSNNNFNIMPNVMIGVKLSKTTDNHVYKLKIPNAVPPMMAFTVGPNKNIKCGNKLIIKEKEYFYIAQLYNEKEEAITALILIKKTIPIRLDNSFTSIPHEEKGRRFDIINNTYSCVTVTACDVYKRPIKSYYLYNDQSGYKYINPSRTPYINIEISEAFRTLLLRTKTLMKDSKTMLTFEYSDDHHNYINVIDGNNKLLTRLFIKSRMLSFDTKKAIPTSI